MLRGNIYADAPDAALAERIETVAVMKGNRIRIERIVTEGQATAPNQWYDQEWDEWVVVLQGGAELLFDDPVEKEHLGCGDWLLIPARRRHRVESAQKGTLWLAVHADGRE